ncbi:MAG: threonine ammonia-lyase [Mycobacteriales bacterium]
MDTPPVSLVGVEDILAARELLADVARTTPMESSRPLSELVGGPVWLKCENLQRAGSFKIRGAYVRIARLAAAERARGVVAASAGNHAQGVALAAALLGTHATIFMPHGAAIPKVTATKGYGATVHLAGSVLDESMVAAREFADRTGAVFIHPFDHADIIAGQGTTGLEILEQCPEVRTIVVATGGGGLVSGIAVAVRATRPDICIVGVQAETAAAYPGSLLAGAPSALTTPMATMADGIAVGRPGELTFAHVRELVDDVVTVSEDALSRALLLLLERAKLVVEPAGAAAVAAVMDAPSRLRPPVVAVLSGGNIDPVVLLRVVRHGMISAGRYLSVRLSIPDRPGALAGLLRLLAEKGANVLDVEHSRTDARLDLGDVEVALSVETRGSDHSEDLMSAMAAAGYRVDDATG